MDIHPKEIGIWWPPAKAPEPLVERVRTNGFKGTPIVPVYRLPDGLNIHHYFVLADGHKRLDAAKKNKLFLPCAVYNPKEIIDPVRDGLDEFEMIGDDHFESVVFIYWTAILHQERLAESGISKSHEGWLEFLSGELESHKD